MAFPTRLIKINIGVINFLDILCSFINYFWNLCHFYRNLLMVVTTSTIYDRMDIGGNYLGSYRWFGCYRSSMTTVTFLVFGLRLKFPLRDFRLVPRTTTPPIQNLLFFKQKLRQPRSYSSILWWRNQPPTLGFSGFLIFSHGPR